MTMRHVLIVVSAGALLAGCGQEAKTTAGASSTAGLEEAIVTWREQIRETHDLCAGKAADMGCGDFQVACKGALPISPDEKGRGVTAKIAVAMTFNGKGASAQDLKPGSSFANFVKTGDSWSRTESKPLNLSTCGEV